MLAGDKNIKDSGKDIVKDNFSIPASYEFKTFHSGSYTKTHKLITALYMVTDIMDKDEPIRNKLRALGTEIISDPEGKPIASYGAGMSIMRIEQIVAFLSIASAMNFISEMNCAILKKEFLELKNSINEHVSIKPTWIEEFLKDSPLEEYPSGGGGRILHPVSRASHPSRGELNSIGHKGHTRIGVQKGSTLMKALSDKMNIVSQTKDFDILKKKRREDILNIIKIIGGNATIKDIMAKMNSGINGVSSFSEKTLQRELVSLIKDGVLYKTGEKRWSRYFIK